MTVNQVLPPTVPMVLPSWFPSHTKKPFVSAGGIPTNGLQPSPVTKQQPTGLPPPRHSTSGNKTSGAKRNSTSTSQPDHSNMDTSETNDALSNDYILPPDIAALAHRILLLTVDMSIFLESAPPPCKFHLHFPIKGWFSSLQ